MKRVLTYILVGCKYFVLQTFLEVVFILFLMYLGFSYSNMQVGNEQFYENVLGILWFHGFFKAIIFGIPFLVLFTSICLIGNFKSKIRYSLVNLILSLSLPITIKFLRDLTFVEMGSVFIATILASLVIILAPRLWVHRKI